MRGENIAAGAPTPESVMDMWMNSDGHRANILLPDLQALALAVYMQMAVTTGCSALGLTAGQQQVPAITGIRRIQGIFW